MIAALSGLSKNFIQNLLIGFSSNQPTEANHSSNCGCGKIDGFKFFGPIFKQSPRLFLCGNIVNTYSSEIFQGRLKLKFRRHVGEFDHIKQPKPLLSDVIEMIT